MLPLIYHFSTGAIPKVIVWNCCKIYRLKKTDVILNISSNIVVLFAVEIAV
jgi:hypothetical protein